jgi:hypothetical protein
MHQDALLESASVLQRRLHRDAGGGKALARPTNHLPCTILRNRARQQKMLLRWQHENRSSRAVSFSKRLQRSLDPPFPNLVKGSKQSVANHFYRNQMTIFRLRVPTPSNSTLKILNDEKGSKKKWAVRLRLDAGPSR